MIGQLLRQEAQITNRSQTGAEDEYQAPTWVDADPFGAWCRVHPMTSEELASRVGSLSTYKGYFSPGENVGVHARVVLATGQGFEVEGKPRLIRSLLNDRASHLLVDLVEVE